MAISFVGQATGTNTATLPAIVAGDVLLVFAYRGSSAITPTAASGFTSINSGAANTNGHNLAYKVAASSADTVGTWTNAEGLLVQVYRGVDQASPVGGNAQMTGILANASDAAYPAATLANATGTSWVAAALGIRSASTAVEAPPTGAGLTNRSDFLVAASLEIAGSDTNGGVTSWPGIGASTTGTRFRSVVVELKAAPAGLTGTLSSTFDALTSAAAAAVVVSGTVSGDLAGLACSATASLKIQGAVAATLSDLSLAGTGAARISADAGVVLDGLAATAAGAVKVSAVVDQSLGALILQGMIGAAYPPVVGALAASLAPVTVAAEGSAPSKGQLVAALDDLVLQGVGRLTVTGALAAALDALVVEARAEITLAAGRPPIARRIRVPASSRRVWVQARPRLVKVK